MSARSEYLVDLKRLDVAVRYDATVIQMPLLLTHFQLHLILDSNP